MNIDEKTMAYVKKKLASSPHDLEHSIRVCGLAKHIAHNSNENVDMEVLVYACYLHDIARIDEDMDISGKIDHAILGAVQAEQFLKSISFKEEKISLIVECIKSHRYRNSYAPKSTEAKILYDADKLDSIGAIGIARTFLWIGENRKKVSMKQDLLEEDLGYNMKVFLKKNIVEIPSYGIQHEFDVKLKKIPNLMHTNYSRKIAEIRVSYLKKFLEDLENDINLNISMVNVK